MMNITRALSISVSCLSLTAGNVFAYSFSGEYLSAPPPSILSTHEHTPQIRKSPHPRGVAESGLLVNRDLNALLGNVPNDSIFDEQIKKTRGSAGIPRQARNDNSFLTASVCFITDTGACSGNSFGSGANTENGGHGTPGGGSGNGGTGDDGKDPDYDLDNAERCKKEGYNLTSCNSVQDAVNKCPYDNSYFEKCVCKSDLVTCTKPQYGVGDSCGGKYASCQTDNPKACKEDGYTNTCASGQKLRKDRRCQYDSSFGICCTESCATNTALTCTGADAGDDGCGYTCKQCCVTTCPSGYDYSESQLTGANGNGWVKDGTDYCDHCTKGRLYKRKAATCSVSQTCSCGGSNQCKSGNNTYYSSCNCCSNCGSEYSYTTKPSTSMCPYGSDRCYDKCTKSYKYSCKTTCTPSCAGGDPNDIGYGNGVSSYGKDECGNTCYSINPNASCTFEYELVLASYPDCAKCELSTIGEPSFVKCNYACNHYSITSATCTCMGVRAGQLINDSHWIGQERSDRPRPIYTDYDECKP